MMSEKPGHSSQRPLTSLRKVAAIVAIALATAIPGLLVAQLISEREDRAEIVRHEVTGAWGPAQLVNGPALVLRGGSESSGASRNLILAPERLSIQGSIAPTTRRRGLFSVIVYEAMITMAGSFELPASLHSGDPDRSKPDAALLTLDASGLQGAQSNDGVEIGGVRQRWQACADAVVDAKCEPFALVVPVDLAHARSGALPFSLTLHLRGTGSLRFASAAKTAAVRIGGAWSTPSFVGTDLPASTTLMGDKFAAQWFQDRIGRPPVTEANSITAVQNSASVSGVDLVEGVPVYRMVNRTAKYGLLIVTLAFAASLLFELTGGVKVTLFQYALLGASLSLFPLLLLAIGELNGFTAGYAVSAIMVVAQASLYSWSVARRLRPALAFATLLAIVFTFMHLLLQLDTYSLLVGTVALFVVLSIIMGVTQVAAGASGLRAPT